MCNALNPNARLMLHEARGQIHDSVALATRISSLNIGAYGVGFAGLENAIKAPIVQKYDDVPKKYWDHGLVGLCRATNLWQQLEDDHRDSIARVDDLGRVQTRYPTTPQYRVLVGSASFAQWTTDMATALGMVDFIQDTVIQNCSVYRRLNL